LSGTVVQNASATAWEPVTKVEFLLTSEDHQSTAIASGLFYYAWLARWNTTTVANGRYLLQSLAFGADGVKTSPSVMITVDNR
jgi:hypothetical protein